MREPHAGDGPFAHGTLSSYVVGFLLSVVLTAVPFAVVMGQALPRDAALAVIVGFAVVQILVHLRYFLHLDLSQRQGWNVGSFVFTVLIVAILVGGAVWIMVSLHYHMMMP